MRLTSGDIRGTGSPGILSGLSISWVARCPCQLAELVRKAKPTLGGGARLPAPGGAKPGEEVDFLITDRYFGKIHPNTDSLHGLCCAWQPDHATELSDTLTRYRARITI